MIFGCVQHQEPDTSVPIAISNADKIEIKYAKGFEVEYKMGHIKIITHSISDNQTFRDSLYLITSDKVTLDPALKSLNPTEAKFACHSSTYLAFFNALGSLNQVNALCGLDYVSNHSIDSVLTQNSVIELCQIDQVQTEALYSAHPDLFLVYPFGSIQDLNYGERGIATLLIAEYLEESQLARLEWIKLFGLLLDKVPEANAYFESVETEYLELKQKAAFEDKKFIMNLPFQDQWFMPSSKSVGVQLIEDAGLSYYYAGNEGTENQIHSKESVWDAGTRADYWIIIARYEGDYSLAQLLAEEPAYSAFKSIKNKQVIFCNTAKVDYFSQGAIEPNVILKDLLFATGQIEDHKPTYFFILE